MKRNIFRLTLAALLIQVGVILTFVCQSHPYAAALMLEAAVLLCALSIFTEYDFYAAVRGHRRER